MIDDRNASDILCAGPPPLSRKLALALQEAIEQAMESPLTDAQRALFEAELIEEWQRSETSRSGIMGAVSEFDSVKAQIKQMPPAKRPHAWREFGRQIYVYAQQEGQRDPVGQLILQTYQAKHDLLISGDPPLTRQAAESYAEMSAFLHALVYNKHGLISNAQKAEVVAELQANFANLSYEIREQISQADSLWGVLRYNWREAKADERERFRQQLKEQAANTAPTNSKSPQPSAASSVTTTDNEPAGEAVDKTQLTPSSTPAQTSSVETVEPSLKELARSGRFIEAMNRLRVGLTKGSLIPQKKK